MEKLTAQEEQAMLYIWEMGDSLIKDVHARYEEPRPPYTTVASIIKNLKRKCYVKETRRKNAICYVPVVSQSEYKRTFMSGFINDYFENSYKEMVTFFARDRKISAEELKEIIDLIEK